MKTYWIIHFSKSCAGYWLDAYTAKNTHHALQRAKSNHDNKSDLRLAPFGNTENTLESDAQYEVNFLNKHAINNPGLDSLTN